ncbi:MAG: hypothetical protein PHR35_05155 [Kiritimatiellae bacterium]|nr:hypothetical protein [Kiritimatiellia bacterium]
MSMASGIAGRGCVMLAAVCLGPVVLHVRGELVLEHDFRTAGAGTVTASVYRSGSSPQAALVGDAAVFPAGDNDLAVWSNSVGIGRLRIPGGANSEATNQLVTSGTENTWYNYMGVTSHGTGVIAMVYRPLWNRSGYILRTWLAHAKQQENQVCLFLGEGNTDDVTARAMWYSGGSKSADAVITNATWTSNGWYLVGMTWKEGTMTRAYFRELANVGATTSRWAEGTTALGESFNLGDARLSVGRREASDTGSDLHSNGDFAIFQLYRNEYWSQSEFEALYANLSLKIEGLVLEYDFRTAPDGATVTASTACAGASGEGSVDGAASVSTGPNVVLSSMGVDAISHGSLSVPAGDGDTSTNRLLTTGDDGVWHNYLGAQDFGTGVVALVYKPNYDGRPAYRHWLLNHGAEAWNATSVSLLTGDGADLLGSFAYYSGGWQTVSATITNGLTWRGGTWYLVGLSWRPGTNVFVYARPLTGGTSAAAATSSSFLLSAPYWIDAPISIGMKGATSFWAEKSADGTFALVRLYRNRYWTENDFDALRESLVKQGTIVFVR